MNDLLAIVFAASNHQFVVSTLKLICFHIIILVHCKRNDVDRVRDFEFRFEKLLLLTDLAGLLEGG